MIGLLMAAAVAAGAPSGIDLPGSVPPWSDPPAQPATRPDAIAACIKNCLVFSATPGPKYPAKGAPVPKTTGERLVALYDADPQLFCAIAEIAFSQTYFLDDDSDHVTLTGGDHKRECKGGQPVEEKKP